MPCFRSGLLHMLCEKTFIKMRRCFCCARSNICIISVENDSVPSEVAAAEYDWCACGFGFAFSTKSRLLTILNSLGDCELPSELCARVNAGQSSNFFTWIEWAAARWITSSVRCNRFGMFPLWRRKKRTKRCSYALHRPWVSDAEVRREASLTSFWWKPDFGPL